MPDGIIIIATPTGWTSMDVCAKLLGILRAKRNGPALDDPRCAPHILSGSLSPVRSQTMLFALEGDGIYVSAGSACAAHKQKVSGVLTAMGLSPAEADCTLRFSLCPDNTEAEMDDVAQCVKKHYDLLKAYVRR